MTTVTLYKEDKDTKLGITFFRRDPQDGASGNSALVSRISPSGLAANELSVGERIMSVQGVSVEGPLHAARMLRESEGFMKIGKLPKRDDFDANLDRYQQMEQEAARNAMAQALPGQEPQRTPRSCKESRLPTFAATSMMKTSNTHSCPRLASRPACCSNRPLRPTAKRPF